MRVRLLCYLFTFGLLLSVLSCNRQNQLTPRTVLRRGMSGEPSTLEPAFAADNFSFEVLRDLYEGLTTDGPNGEVLPAVASSWTVDAAGTKYTFQIRPEATWSNGSRIKAQDFINAWRLVVDPKQGSPVADDLRIISGAASIINGNASAETLGAYAQSDSVLVVVLEKPAPYLPQLLTHSAAYPKYSVHDHRANSGKDWVSNGPYVLSAWSPGTTIELVQNKRYWDIANVKINRVEYQFADESSQYSRYRSDQLDMTDTVPLNAVSALRKNQPTELIIAPFLATAYYGLNLQKPPFADNRQLRQAIVMAIDRKLLVRSMGFNQPEAYGFVPPGTWNYSPQSWPWHDMQDRERIAEARRLYTSAGYSALKPLHLRLLFNSNPVIKNTAIIIAQMWKETLGIETTLTEEEYRVFLLSRHDQSKWDVARLGWTADFNDASNFLDIFRQHSSNNDVGYSNDSFDDLLDHAAQSSNPQNRRVILETAERKMLDEYPVAPLYFYISKRLVKPYIRGAKVNSLNRIGSKSLSFSTE